MFEIVNILFAPFSLKFMGTICILCTKKFPKTFCQLNTVATVYHFLNSQVTQSLSKCIALFWIFWIFSSLIHPITSGDKRNCQTFQKVFYWSLNSLWCYPAFFAVYWKNRTEESTELLQKLEKFRANESKRPGNPKTTKELFGIEGSFRKLEIDWNL